MSKVDWSKALIVEDDDTITQGGKVVGRVTQCDDGRIVGKLTDDEPPERFWKLHWMETAVCAAGGIVLAAMLGAWWPHLWRAFRG